MEQIQDNNSNNYLYVVENYRNICYNVNQLKSKYRSDSDNIEIMAVTKTVTPEIVNVAIENGVSLLGENRVQEFLSKKNLYNKKAQVHFIGTLQTNKVKYIINDVSMIQSVDSFKLANEINKQAKKNNRVMDVLIEVNIGDESTKSGVDSNDVSNLLDEISSLDNVRIKGLMAIPPINAPEALYEKMYQLFIDMGSKKLDNISMDILSMGMTNDYQLAIKYGSNIIRIGTGLFGKRN